MDAREDSAAFFAELSKELLAESDEAPTVDRVTRRALDVVPACELCGVSLRRRRGRVESLGATSPLVEKCDAYQYELSEGPCLEAIKGEEVYVVHDTASDPRWPRWGPRVAELGVRSLLSIRLTGSESVVGALNLYATGPHAFSVDDVEVATVYASHAGAAVRAAQIIEGLTETVHGRHLIGVAQGMLMQRYDLSMETAFEVLRRYSSHRNLKLREVAKILVDTGRLPGEGGSDSA